MTHRTLLSISVSILIAPLAFAAEDPSVEELWTKWKSGDEAAYHRLLELGPETRELARRILKPEGEGFATSLGRDEAALLEAMQADVVPDLMKGIDRPRSDDDRDDRIGFIVRLGSLGRMARPAGDVLLKIALEVGEEDEENEIDSEEARADALQALARIQTKKDVVITEALKLLATTWSSASSRRLGIQLVESDRVAVDAMKLLPVGADDRSRTAVVDVIRFYPSPQVRVNAIAELLRIAPEDESNVRILIDSLDDNRNTATGSPADQAMSWILEYPELPDNAAAGLIEKFYRQSYEGRNLDLGKLVEAICRCQATDVHAAELVAQKIRPLLNKDAYFHKADAQLFRVSAACVVLKWYPTDEIAATFLAEVVSQTTDRDFNASKGGRYPDVRAQAANGLSQLGSAGKQWLPLLHRVLDREIKTKPYISELAFAAAWAIAQIDSTDTKCLKVLRDSGLEFLHWRRISWPRIESVLGQRAALLVNIDEVLPELRDAQFIVDKPWTSINLRWIALRPHREAVVPVLLEHLQSNRIDVRIAAAEFLAHLQVSPEIAIPGVAALLNDRYATVRAAAAETLSEFGPAATIAIPALERATNDEYLTVKLAAEDALSVIRKMPFD